MPRAVTLLHDFLHDSAARLPDKCALVCAGRGSTYAELEAASWLRPDSLTGSADLDVRDIHVRVTIQAPALLV